MRDPRYENMWGENPEEQERRRQWLGDVYDRAAGLKSGQTPIPDHGQFNQTPYNPSDRFGQTPYQPKNELNNDSSFMQQEQKQPQYTPVKRDWQLSDMQNPTSQIVQAAKKMADEYFLMHGHKYKNLDDYHHCKANYNAAQQGAWGNAVSHLLGTGKEVVDFGRNTLYKGLSINDALKDMQHDLAINQIGRDRARSSLGISAQDACADFRQKNPKLPKEYW